MSISKSSFIVWLFERRRSWTLAAVLGTDTANSPETWDETLEHEFKVAKTTFEYLWNESVTRSRDSSGKTPTASQAGMH
jgi:hypothetical protein